MGINDAPDAHESRTIFSIRSISNEKNVNLDRNCKVFGQENLYLIGSSIFPTGGYAPPLTIVQLANRLGDHLKGV